jgi:hypothetical protein
MRRAQSSEVAHGDKGPNGKFSWKISISTGGFRGTPSVKSVGQENLIEAAARQSECRATELKLSLSNRRERSISYGSK